VRPRSSTSVVAPQPGGPETVTKRFRSISRSAATEVPLIYARHGRTPDKRAGSRELTRIRANAERLRVEPDVTDFPHRAQRPTVSELTDSGSDGEGGAEPSARALLREALAGEDAPAVEFDPETVPISDADVLDRLSPPVRRWWVSEFAAHVGENGGLFTPTSEGDSRVDDGENCLVAAPTGSGKTLAAFTAVLDDLFARDRAGTLDNSVYCLYVSPLKSLANDIERNLEAPLNGIAAEMTAASESDEDEEVDPGVRQAIRHGDTSKADRRAMLEETPHVLNTTPETLAILLNAPRFREKLRTVEYVVVDEIHALAGNKRGDPPLGLAGATDGNRRRFSDPDRLFRDGRAARRVADFLVGCERVAGEVGDPDGFAPATARSWTPGSAASSICNSERRRPTSSTHLIRSSPTGSTTRSTG